MAGGAGLLGHLATEGREVIQVDGAVVAASQEELVFDVRAGGAVLRVHQTLLLVGALAHEGLSELVDARQRLLGASSGR